MASYAASGDVVVLPNSPWRFPILAADPDVAPFYYRTADGAEIDLVIEQAGKPKVAIEVKRASAPQAERGFFVAYDDLKIENRIVVGAGAADYPAKGGVKVRTLLSAVREVREVLKSLWRGSWNVRRCGGEVGMSAGLQSRNVRLVAARGVDQY